MRRFGPAQGLLRDQKGLYSDDRAFLCVTDNLTDRSQNRIIMTHWMSDIDKPDEQAELAVKPRSRPQRPPMYKVLMLNDDFTPMEFVVHVLERLFNMTHAQAIEIMLTVHRKGVAVVGVFSHEVAETKVAQVMELARRQQHPLQCTMEKE